MVNRVRRCDVNCHLSVSSINKETRFTAWSKQPPPDLLYGHPPSITQITWWLMTGGTSKCNILAVITFLHTTMVAVRGTQVSQISEKTQINNCHHNFTTNHFHLHTHRPTIIKVNPNQNSHRSYIHSTNFTQHHCNLNFTPHSG